MRSNDGLVSRLRQDNVKPIPIIMSSHRIQHRRASRKTCWSVGSSRLHARDRVGRFSNHAHTFSHRSAGGIGLAEEMMQERTWTIEPLQSPPCKEAEPYGLRGRVRRQPQE